MHVGRQWAADEQTDKHLQLQAARYTGTQADRATDEQTDNQPVQADRDTDTQTGRATHAEQTRRLTASSQHCLLTDPVVDGNQGLNRLCLDQIHRPIALRFLGGVLEVPWE